MGEQLTFRRFIREREETGGPEDDFAADWRCANGDEEPETLEDLLDALPLARREVKLAAREVWSEYEHAKGAAA